MLVIENQLYGEVDIILMDDNVKRVSLIMSLSIKERAWMMDIALRDNETMTSMIAIFFEKRSKELGIPIPKDKVALKRRRYWVQGGSSRKSFMDLIDKELGLK